MLTAVFGNFVILIRVSGTHVLHFDLDTHSLLTQHSKPDLATLKNQFCCSKLLSDSEHTDNNTKENSGKLIKELVAIEFQ